MEMSTVIKLKGSSKKMTETINKVEMELNKNEYRIVNRLLSGKFLIIIYENNLSVATSEFLKNQNIEIYDAFIK